MSGAVLDTGAEVMGSINADDIKGFQIFKHVGRPICIHVDLDAVAFNTDLMRKHCVNKDVGIMAVLKSNCYGHGANQIGRHLIETGAAERLAVATVAEGVLLRKGKVKGPIHIFGNVQDWEMSCCLENDLIPSIADVAAVQGMAKAIQEERSRQQSASTQEVPKGPFNKRTAPHGAVHIKLDTGMRRNGCQPEDLDSVVGACDELGVPLEGILSHISKFGDPDFTNIQLDVFQKSTSPYKGRGLLLHIAAAGPVLNNQGSHYDLVRPGITLLGAPADSDVERFASLGFKPTLEIKGYPTLVKLCKAGVPVGYACAYTCPEDEWIATFPIGYADGYWRSLEGKGAHVRRDKTGEKCPVIGKISMDAILVRLPCKPDADEVFTLVTADFDPQSSIMGLCQMVDSIPQEALARLAPRIPRVYTSQTLGTVEILTAWGLNHVKASCANPDKIFEASPTLP